MSSITQLHKDSTKTWSKQFNHFALMGLMSLFNYKCDITFHHDNHLIFAFSRILQYLLFNFDETLWWTSYSTLYVLHLFSFGKYILTDTLIITVSTRFGKPSSFTCSCDNWIRDVSWWAIFFSVENHCRVWICNDIFESRSWNFISFHSKRTRRKVLISGHTRGFLGCGIHGKTIINLESGSYNKDLIHLIWITFPDW